MAYCELIQYSPHRAIIVDDCVSWEPVNKGRKIDGLPQIFWADGTPWREVNLWAHERATSRDVKLDTVQGAMRHLLAYANFLEKSPLDWRHFPQTKADRVLVKWRGNLIDARDDGRVSSSTTSHRMRATIQFYRFAFANNLIDRSSPMWNDHKVVVRYINSVGFERSFATLSTDLSIPNRPREGLRLEDGLLPIAGQDMHELLVYTASGNASKELDLMLNCGFFTGARLQTICDLKIQTLDRAVPDPGFAGIWRLRVGPSVSPPVATKFSVTGEILIPKLLLDDLKAYAYSSRRLEREALAAQGDKDLVFLTRFGNSYGRRSSGGSPAINTEMSSLRKAAEMAGLKFMRNFHFHMSRATYGTWLMKIALSVLDPIEAIALVRDAMLHKNESTTWLYIKFIERSKAKVVAGNEFSNAFMGIRKRTGATQNA